MREIARVVTGVVALAVAVGLGPVIRPDIQAQEQGAAAPPAFEVASIKKNKSGDVNVGIGVRGGRYTVSNAPLRLLIRNAYQLQDSQIVGGPDWLMTDRFDIVASLGAQPELPYLKLRTLLTERFKLKTHTEPRELPVYAMVLAREDKKVGPQLKPAKIDCAAMLAARRGGPSAGPPSAPTDPNAPLPCSRRIGPASIQAEGVTMAETAALLATHTGRLVVDRTGLAGQFDFELTFTPDNMPRGLTPGAPVIANGVAIDPDGPSLFTALQEQLELKLESARAPVDVLVIDSVEQPTED